MKGLWVAVLFLAAGGASADDETVRARIEERLRKSNITAQADVTVAVESGQAVLTGVATQLQAAREAERLASKEVRTVDNRIRVVPEARTDSQIAQEVRDAVLGYIHYGVFDSVEGQVQDGSVRLGGSVRHPYRRQDIEERVARIAGVREIHNDIQVQSLSSYDEDLRHHLYRAIYGGALAGRGSAVNPPVHIVVDRGRITLTGYVNSSVEKAVVGSIARETLAFSVDNRLQVEGEEEKEPARGL